MRVTIILILVLLNIQVIGQRNRSFEQGLETQFPCNILMDGPVLNISLLNEDTMDIYFVSAEGWNLCRNADTLNLISLGPLKAGESTAKYELSQQAGNEFVCVRNTFIISRIKPGDTVKYCVKLQHFDRFVRGEIVCLYKFVRTEGDRTPASIDSFDIKTIELVRRDQQKDILVRFQADIKVSDPHTKSN